MEVTRVLVDSYFDIVRKNLQDAVPKALMHFLVNSVRRGLQQHLIRTLYREELFAEIMGEREDVAAKRHQCQEVRGERRVFLWEVILSRRRHRNKLDMGIWDETGAWGTVEDVMALVSAPAMRVCVP